MLHNGNLDFMDLDKSCLLKFNFSWSFVSFQKHRLLNVEYMNDEISDTSSVLSPGFITSILLFIKYQTTIRLNCSSCQVLDLCNFWGGGQG